MEEVEYLTQRDYDTNIVQHKELGRLEFSRSDASWSKLCAIYKAFHIRAVPELPHEENYIYFTLAWHELHKEYEDDFPGFPRMNERATDGCLFCRFLIKSLVSERDMFISKHGPTLERIYGTKVVRIILTASIDERVKYGSVVEAYKSQEPCNVDVSMCHRAECHSNCYHIFAYQISFQMSSEAPLSKRVPLSVSNIGIFKKWLQDCDTNHSVCRAALTGYMPNRLLAVKKRKLQIVEGGSEYHRYVALSYCWGRLLKKEKAFLTANSNSTARISGFDLAELPRTLRHAIGTVRALGIGFIWVDSLCIIQDNDDDWTRESSQMSKIYRHAYLTIAVANSDSSLAGFLDHRDPSCRVSLAFDFSGIRPVPSETVVNERGAIHFRYPLVTSVESHLSACEWNRRGWTLQESLLSTRTLYFTKDVAYFECVSGQQVESPGYELPPPLPFRSFLAESSILSAAERKERREDYFSSWYRIVEMYTPRILSFAKDRLPALDGLAQSMKNLVDDTYIYGLWKDDLHRGLLWIGGINRLPQKAGAPCPSWAWPSRDGSVCWDKATFKHGWKPLISNVDVTLPKECAHCGHTRGAELKLTAPVALLKDILMEWVPPSGDPDDWESPDSWAEYDEFGKFEIDDDKDMPLSPADTMMMLVAERKESENVQAILIQPSSVSGCFRRVGLFIHKETGGDVTEDDYDERNSCFDDLRPLFEEKEYVLV